MVRVNLTPNERAIAASEGYRRQRANVAEGRSGTDGTPGNSKAVLAIHVMGAFGELAVAKYLGLLPELRELWATQLTAVRGTCDLPHGIDVKTTSYPGGRLLLYDWEFRGQEKTYVLVTMPEGMPHIVGWASTERVRRVATAGTRGRGERGRPLRWEVQQRDLLPIEDLKLELDAPAGTV